MPGIADPAACLAVTNLSGYLAPVPANVDIAGEGMAVAKLCITTTAAQTLIDLGIDRGLIGCATEYAKRRPASFAYIISASRHGWMEARGSKWSRLYAEAILVPALCAAPYQTRRAEENPAPA